MIVRPLAETEASPRPVRPRSRQCATTPGASTGFRTQCRRRRGTNGRTPVASKIVQQFESATRFCRSSHNSLSACSSSPGAHW